jgi:hypothetical protein
MKRTRVRKSRETLPLSPAVSLQGRELVENKAVGKFSSLNIFVIQNISRQTNAFLSPFASFYIFLYSFSLFPFPFSSNSVRHSPLFFNLCLFSFLFLSCSSLFNFSSFYLCDIFYNSLNYFLCLFRSFLRCPLFPHLFTSFFLLSPIFLRSFFSSHIL